MLAVGITLLTALLLSAVAAYFSIAGLMAIFSSAVIPIAVMGGTLELAKIVTASWLYRNWKTAPILFRYYLVSSTIILSCTCCFHILISFSIYVKWSKVLTA